LPIGDLVDVTSHRLLGQRPDLDLTGWQLMARCARIVHLCTQALTDALKPFGLSQHEYVVLASLRDLGPPYASSPSRLLEVALVTTSGGLTNMLHRLEDEGLIQRAPDPDDRRGVQVTLTDKGLELVQQATTHYIAAANRFVAGVAREQIDGLTQALHLLLMSIEPVMLEDPSR